MDIRRTDDRRKEDEYLKECAERLLYIKFGNNRFQNNRSRVQNDVLNEKKREFSNMVVDPEKYSEELKKRVFALDASLTAENITKSGKKLNNIKLMPVKDNTKGKSNEDKSMKFER